MLSYILYVQAPEIKYTQFLIPKRGGGDRLISAPIASLKRLQRNLADLLQDCLDELVEAKKRNNRVSHGFSRTHSIMTNAQLHRNRRWVFNLDLADFFPSINFGRVRGFLIRSNDFGLVPEVATVLAQIACYNNALPQGSPCSPVFGNLIAHVLDMRLLKICRSVGCTYTRYADDLTFSTNKKEFPSELASWSEDPNGGGHIWTPGERIRDEIRSAGFAINEKKTRMMYRSSRQEVTGLVINDTIKARWEYRNTARAMVDRFIKTGAFEILGAVKRNGTTFLEKRSGSVRELHGILGFIDSVNAYNETKAKSKTNGLSAERRLYREFLLYTMFYATDKPMILCEGPTDNIYLTHAIRSLAVEFPELAETSADDHVHLKVRFFRYPKSSTTRLLGLNDGGSAVLGQFIARYRSETDGFSGPGLQEPVIVLYDNDTGAPPVLGNIKQIRKSLCRTMRDMCTLSKIFMLSERLGRVRRLKISSMPPRKRGNLVLRHLIQMLRQILSFIIARRYLLAR